MKRLVIVAMCLCAQQCLAQTTPPADIKTLKAKYEQGLAAIQEDTNKALTNSVQGYADALKALGQKLQGAGDLDGMLGVKKESERFEKEKTIPESAVVADCAALRDLQTKWQKMPDTIDISKSKKIVTLSRSHIAALEEVKKQLTMQGKVDEAVEAKNEIERVRTSAEVTAAEFVLTIDLAAKTNAVVKAVAPTRTDPLARLRSSLVLYYSFDREEKGLSKNGKVTDKSGKRHDGTVSGAKWTGKGKVGGAYEFNGKDSYIDAKADFSGADEISACGWSWLPNTPGDSILMGQFGQGAPQDVWGLFSAANGIGAAVGIVNSSGNAYHFQLNELVVSKWQHLCLTYSRGKALTLYVDGVPARSVAVPDLPLRKNHNYTAKVGSDQGGGGYWASGLIDEVMIFNRALSDSEVKQIYDAQK